MKSTFERSSLRVFKKTCASLIMFASAWLNVTAQSETSLDGRLKLSRHFFNLEYNHLWGDLPNNGLSLGYLINPGKKGIYYVGSSLSLISNNKKTETLEWVYQSVYLQLTQRIFLAKGNRVLPFIDAETGYVYIQNNAAIPLKLGAKAPGILGAFGFRYATGGEDTQIIKSQSFVYGFSIGCLVRYRGSGFTVKAGYQYAGRHEFIDKRSVGKTINHATMEHELGYNTYKTQLTQLTLGIGFLIGSISYSRK